MELMEGLLTRRSVRKFADKPVAKQDIIDIIKAAQHAPSAITPSLGVFGY